VRVALALLLLDNAITFIKEEQAPWR
jgi:hypothetical protein